MIAAHQLVAEQDRKLAEKELLSASCTSLPNRLQSLGKSPRSKFLKTEKLAALPVTPRQQPAQRPPLAAATQTFVSVQEPAFIRDWNGFTPRGEKYENFKSPSLFWEIRLKESKITAEKASRPTLNQIIELCEVLEEYSKRLSSQGDIVFPSVKEQASQPRMSS